jgi:hypothetical protein
MNDQIGLGGEADAHEESRWQTRTSPASRGFGLTNFIVAEDVAWSRDFCYMRPDGRLIKVDPTTGRWPD